MRILKWLTPIFTGGALAVLAACASASEPTLQPAAAPAGQPAQLPPVSTGVGAPVPLSDVGIVFAKPLSSGLSVADVTENALPSIVQIIAGSGAGTGFIINEDGLAVTNRHVVEGSNRVTVRLATGGRHQGSVTRRHSILDLAYVRIDSNRRFAPIAIGDSNRIRVGEDVIAIGFPLDQALGLDPTVSVGIISAKRNNLLQTDASLNPGNSGGPLLDMFGHAVGVVVSRMETTDSGRPIFGIGFAIPISAVHSGLGGQVSRAGRVLPTPTLGPLSTIAPPPNIEATKAALDAIDAHRRQAELATRTAIEAKQEAERYAASLEATRVAELPTPTPRPTPTPEPTPTPLPTPTPHPRAFCQEWEALVLEWIKQGNNYYKNPRVYRRYLRQVFPDVPDHPQLSAKEAHGMCLTEFPFGILSYGTPSNSGDTGNAGVGYGRNQLLPGLYEYRREGDKRVPGRCELRLYMPEGNQQIVEMPTGEPFTFRFYQYHGRVGYYNAAGEYNCRDGALYRIRD